MAKSKRSAEDETVVDLGDVHPSRAKRVKYTEENAGLARIYDQLADEVQAVRIQAAGDLFKTLSTDSSGQLKRLEAAERRLIRGLCSSRKAARLGFSVALTEVFRLRFSVKPESTNECPNLEETINKVHQLTTANGNVSGQEKRDASLGRRYAFQAVLHSDVGLNEHLPDEQWRTLIHAIFELAYEKEWLRRECGAMLHEYLTSANAFRLSDSRVRIIIDELITGKQTNTPEGVGIWITVQQRFPESKLPKHVWHHRDPLSHKDRSLLAKIMLDAHMDDEEPKKKAGSRQSVPSFAWQLILSQMYDRGAKKDFSQFWEDVVASTMFTPKASAERKAYGIQVLSHAISTAPPSMIESTIGNAKIMQCILDQRASPEQYLFDASKVPLNQAVTRAKKEHRVVPALFQSVVRFGANFDQLTKTKTVETLIGLADIDGLNHIVEYIRDQMVSPGTTDQRQMDNRRRGLADLLLSAIRAHRDPIMLFRTTSNMSFERFTPWVEHLLEVLASFGYEKQRPEVHPEISEASQSMFRSRLMSCLDSLLHHPIQFAPFAPLHVVSQLSKSTRLENDVSEGERDVLREALAIANITRAPVPNKVLMGAFQLLLSLSMLQVYSREPDSVEALSDLIACYQSRNDDGDSYTMLMELLLSFISKPSKLYRKLAAQVFPVFAEKLTRDSLQSLIDIIDQKESLSGQQELFDQDDPVENVRAGAEEDGIDVEDASDIELVNGHQVLTADAEEDDEEEGDDKEAGDDSDDESDASSERSIDSSSRPQGASSPDDIDEVAVFERKLADALGTANAGDDSDDDGSDMDDERMMALEPHLMTIFQERQKDSSKKQDKKDAKENIVNFKNRVLDLLQIYVKTQYSNVLALDLILPIVTLIRTTTSKQTAEKAFEVQKQYFNACSKHKGLPQPDDHDACFEVLAAVHHEMKLGGSKLHANACSRSSLFLSKVLVGMDQQHYERIAEMYAKLQREWYLDARSKVPGSVFTEWTSWSITTRKQN